MTPAQAKDYKAQIADLYSRRSDSYDSSAWHAQIARKLVDLSGIRSGANMLDICTGTGMVALYAAEKIGSKGSIIGVDISEGMLKKAHANAISAGIVNVSFAYGDGEHLDFPPDSFDTIFCSSAFIWMTDLTHSLTRWKDLLKPGGKLGFHAFSETAFVSGVVAQAVLSKYGVDYQMNRPAGSVDKCHALMECSGFRNIRIEVDASSNYISLEEARRAWVGVSHPAPGQYPHPLSALLPAELDAAYADYIREMERRNGACGIRNDMTVFYVFGEKALAGLTA